MSLSRWGRGAQSPTLIATPFSCLSISTRQNASAPMASKHIFMAATACRSLRLFIILSPAARRHRIAKCGAVVTTSCEKQGSGSAGGMRLSDESDRSSVRSKCFLSSKTRRRDCSRSPRTQFRRQRRTTTRVATAKAFRCNRTSTKPR